MSIQCNLGYFFSFISYSCLSSLICLCLTGLLSNPKIQCTCCHLSLLFWLVSRPGIFIPALLSSFYSNVVVLKETSLDPLVRAAAALRHFQFPASLQCDLYWSPSKHMYLPIMFYICWPLLLPADCKVCTGKKFSCLEISEWMAQWKTHFLFLKIWKLWLEEVRWFSQDHS